MRPERYHAEDLVHLLRSRKIATMSELKEALGTQADATLFRKLESLAYRTSYSHRGRYYTLEEIALSMGSLSLIYKTTLFSPTVRIWPRPERVVLREDLAAFSGRLAGWNPVPTSAGSAEVSADNP